ncbi:MAG: PglZ domain-containing protein [Flavobacteriales bacterium]|nr:PglZ domain-containing protein [Flavobacteriales bacterium]
MEKINILWADDEIELLKPHIIFLNEKGYLVDTVNNGDDAIELFKEKDFDLVFLDENMPGKSGLEVLAELKSIRAEVPIIMITKSEEEHIMEEAIGSKISDYLIKPVNPHQILLSIKKNIDNKRIISEKTTMAYQQEFRNIGMTLSDDLNLEEWKDIYRKLVYWEMELQESKNSGMEEVLRMQKNEANRRFCEFVEENYLEWLSASAKDRPTLSHTLFKNKIAPHLQHSDSLFMIVIDNLRFDQWKVIQPIITEYYKIDEEDIYCSILPTATHYARNAIFAGLMPSEIEKLHPRLWLNEDDEGGKNMHEEELLAEQLKRMGLNIKFSYNKITNLAAGKKLSESIKNLLGNKLNVIVYNFVDMLSHARTDMEVIRELADDEAAYRSITLSWFEHSPLLDIIRKAAEFKASMIITTDHGSIRVKDPIQVVGDKNTTTNLRYKQGKNLRYEAKDVFEISDPAKGFLPKINVSTRYIFAREDKFFAYPNNYNYYVNYYRNTFQHGGISLEEMLIPVVKLTPR